MRWLQLRPKTLALITASCLLTVPMFIPDASAQQPPKPNVVFILADNVGYGDLGCLRRRRIARRSDAAH